ncbi:MAG: FcoT family thioesterase [Planctomycetota bacterium]
MNPARSIPVPKALLARVLAPYRDGCRYVRSAQVEIPAVGDPSDDLVRIRAEMSIPESCYIDDTGHFNSVEFNLSYNQLVYTLMAQCVADDLLPCFARMTLEEYLARQLPDVLIHDFQSKFKRPMDPRDYRGVVAITKASERGRFLMLQTRAAFEDDGGGSCDGHVTLAIVDGGAARAAAGNESRESGAE